MKKGYGRYLVKFSSYKGKIKVDVIDEYWGGSDYAFFVPGSTICTSYSDVAARSVQNAMDKAPELFKVATPGSCYKILTDGAFGNGVGVEQIPVSWFMR